MPMGEPAKVVKITSEKPSLDKPLSLFYWSLPNGQYFGNSTNRLAQVGNQFQDGLRTSGKITEILMYPVSGVVMIEVQPFAMTGVNNPNQELPPKQYVLCTAANHGSVLTAENIEEMKKRGVM